MKRQIVNCRYCSRKPGFRRRLCFGGAGIIIYCSALCCSFI
nr:MAG TPA: hypothetical protein [Caudoviricetes sp.]DAM11636.1 MAG TPA: hypothetical protein [Caudoviricetes sp.]DAP27242.1 MAG TPA: hypothetical protein [Caudoviricetes sp.]